MLLNVKDLSIRKRDNFLLKDINFSVNRGEIYGLVGPNGSGKTTLIKALLGLIELCGGSIQLQNSIINGIAQPVTVGSLIERAPLYDHLSASDNLEITAIQLGISRSRIVEVLSLVDLQKDSFKIVKKFSLGMKQRLGLALAMLHNPDILILDEPTNGLDPEGIMQIRKLLLSINQERGTTIVLSSHLLNELEKVATHVGLILEGRMVFNGTLESFKKTDTFENKYSTFVK